MLGTNEMTSPTLYPTIDDRLVTVKVHPVGIGSLNVGKVKPPPPTIKDDKPVAVNACTVSEATEVIVPPVAR
jgi:hypothetical protein